MANIIYAKSTGKLDPMIGKLETPLKMIIEHESDNCVKRNDVRKGLFNIEKSNKFGETIVGTSDFDTFMAVVEGGGAENDSIETTYKKFIEHIQFMKEFTITAEMMEDANHGVSADARRRAENFTRAYYKTMNKICEKALAHGTAKSFVFNKAEIDTTVYDGQPLFHKAHKYTSTKMKNKGTQANRFCCTGITADTESFEKALNVLANKMRNFKDENGEALGYIADTIILPGNHPGLEAIAKKVCGSERTTGNNNNDINIQYGNWTITVLLEWQTEAPAFMVMSSEANKQLSGNVFFNRVPLKITNWVDNHTGNYIWNGRCRFGVGFGSYKHILLAEDGNDTANCEVFTI